MTGPIEPLRPPLVERTVPARPVVRRHEEPADDESRRGRDDEQPRGEADDDEGQSGLHVDVLA
jgi:hypothetical protein